MDDLLLKYAMIIVGVVVFGLLISFSFTALKANPIPEKKFQDYNEEPKKAVNYFSKLCEICLGQKNYQRDCYIINYDNPGPESLTKIMFEKSYDKIKIELSNDLPPKKFTIKVMSIDNVCVLKVLD